MRSQRKKRRHANYFVRQRRKAKKAQRLEDGKVRLQQMHGPELFAFAQEKIEDELHHFARKLLEKREGRTWKIIRKEAEAPSERTLRARDSADSVQQGRGKDKTGKHQGVVAEARKKKTRQSKKKGSCTGFGLDQPGSGYGYKGTIHTYPATFGNEYLKPVSEKYDMAEYDLE